MENSHSKPLHHFHVHKIWATINRIYALFHILALVAIFYYRGAFFFNKTDAKYSMIPSLPWLVIFSVELLLSFLWLLKQSFSWRPVSRTAFPERLPKDEELPGIDVVICTADAEKEPTLDVMNTVISAMALDYPAQKLSVYLSDDGGASVTLNGMKAAWVFATWWLPFCRRYNVKPICPQAYFEEPQEDRQDSEYFEDRKILKDKFEIFKQRVRSRAGKSQFDGDAKTSAQDHPALIQVINRSVIEDDDTTINTEHSDMPFLVYVAREKRESHPHHFKAGALNVLLRVSGTFSNSPYILVLDCDMYCNDSVSARQAMCFYFDPKISPTLGWVQFPQKFHNVGDQSDIYDSQLRSIFLVYWLGADGLQGPVISGTNFYINRKALYGSCEAQERDDLKKVRDAFGASNEFIKSLSYNSKCNTNELEELSSKRVQEAQFLASCTYENDTKWGEEAGFRYDSVVEDAMTSYILHSRGWRSVYLNPPRPQFLGSATTNLNESLIQNTRWATGLIDIGLSKYFPLFHTPSRMKLLQRMCYSWITLFPLDCIPITCFATIPPICFFYGIPLYPKLSDPFFTAFAFAFISYRLKHLWDILFTGGSVRTWLDEQRISMIKGVTCYVYGVLDSVMTKIGLREASFIPTNKAGDDETTKWYKIGKYDFRTSDMFLVPLATLVALNLVCCAGGVARVIMVGNWDAMFAQMFLSFYALAMSFPVIQGMLLRQDNGCVLLSATLKSSLFSIVLLSLGYFILVH